MSDSGVAIDVANETVIIVGTELINKILTPGGRAQTLKDFNNTAVAILKVVGPEHGVNLECADFSNWCLGTTTEEDNYVMLSYLADPSAEIYVSRIEPDITPTSASKPTLH